MDDQEALRAKLAEQRARRAQILGMSLEEYARRTADEPDMWLGDDRSLAEQPDLDEDELDEDAQASAGPSTTPTARNTPGARVCASQTLGPGGVTRHTRSFRVDLRGVSASLAARLTKRAPGAS
jgi:hypothetical protein